MLSSWLIGMCYDVATGCSKWSTLPNTAVSAIHTHGQTFAVSQMLLHHDIISFEIHIAGCYLPVFGINMVAIFCDVMTLTCVFLMVECFPRDNYKLCFLQHFTGLFSV